MLSATFSVPSMKAVQKRIMFSAVISEDSGLYLVISSSRVIRRITGHSSFLRPKNSRILWLSSTSLSMKMKRICGEREFRSNQNAFKKRTMSHNIIDRDALTLPLKPSAAFLNWSILSLKSSAVLGTNIRMWDLMSPPKILGAVCSEGIRILEWTFSHTAANHMHSNSQYQPNTYSATLFHTTVFFETTDRNETKIDLKTKQKKPTCSVNSMTRGSWLALMKFCKLSLLISPSKAFRPSSNLNTKSKTLVAATVDIYSAWHAVANNDTQNVVAVLEIHCLSASLQSVSAGH